MVQQSTLKELNSFELPIHETHLLMPVEGSLIGKWDLWLRPWIGIDWREVPAWVAEAWYFRIFLADREYFEPGPTYLIDPWLEKKQAEKWYGEAEIKLLKNWINHSQSPNYYEKIEIEIGDNARITPGEIGSSLFKAIILAAKTLSLRPQAKVSLDFYQFPFHLQSTSQDYFHMLAWLLKSGPVSFQFALQLNDWTQTKRLSINTHNWWNSPGYFSELPQDIYKVYAASSSAVFIGDLNRRRFSDDRKGLKVDQLQGIIPCPFFFIP